MNDQINTGTEQVQPPVTMPNPSQPELKDRIINSFKGFYSNKKIFIPITAALGLIILTVIIGLIFGAKRQSTTQVKGTPTPIPVVTESPKPIMSTVSEIEIELAKLKDQITNLDVKQSRLQPPVLNFDINF